MKTIAIIIYMIISIACIAQEKVVIADNVTLDSDYSYSVVLNKDGDYRTTYESKDFRYSVYFEFLNLTGTLDAVVGIKKIVTPLTIPQYICEDTTIAAHQCKFEIDATPYFFSVKDGNAFADSLIIEIAKNNVTGGTMSIVLMKNWNRD